MFYAPKVLEFLFFFLAALQDNSFWEENPLKYVWSLKYCCPPKWVCPLNLRLPLKWGFPLIGLSLKWGCPLKWFLVVLTSFIIYRNHDSISSKNGFDLGYRIVLWNGVVLWKNILVFNLKLTLPPSELTLPTSDLILPTSE